MAGNGLPHTWCNECMIMYILAAASPTHGYRQLSITWLGAERSYRLPIKWKASNCISAIRARKRTAFGGSILFLGLDPVPVWRWILSQLLPRNAQPWHWWTVLIASRNPNTTKVSGPDCWGLTASYCRWIRGSFAEWTGWQRGNLHPRFHPSSIHWNILAPHAPSICGMREIKCSGPFRFCSDAFSETGLTGIRNVVRLSTRVPVRSWSEGTGQGYCGNSSWAIPMYKQD